MAAQAARLSLRMQKELKLLIADPPPGASFPLLSDNSSPLSLSSIHAEIKGPEGTVYEDGVFDIRIQIPDRYPFQPPAVTFATPIYHPNIDTGGRICLDILNLPPKGAWQPSLNVSTVITSIGLLLSEPNPDDGLMCEASREYKYNRQAFDQKARAMTEKYARRGASEGICMKATPTQDESKTEADKSVQDLKDKSIGGTQFKRKVTLESSTSSRNMVDDRKKNEVSNYRPFVNESSNQNEIEGAQKELKCATETPNWGREKRKLSLGSSSQSLKRSSNDKENIPEDESVLATNSQQPRGIFPTLPLGSSDGTDVIEKKNLKNPEALGSDQTHGSTATNPVWFKPQEPKSVGDGKENEPSGTSLKKLCLGGKRLSLGLRGSSAARDKENVNPMEEVPSGKNKGYEYSGNSATMQAGNATHSDFDKKPVCGRIENQESDESVIVLDSEDSEEDDKSVPLRVKPILARKRLGKWKLKT